MTATVADVPFAALAPLILIGVAFVVYCVVDIVRAPAVRHLPKWLWVVICLISVLFFADGKPLPITADQMIVTWTFLVCRASNAAHSHLH